MKEINALVIAVQRKLVPLHVKALIIFTVAYALSPIDLIPDFIPVLGLLDDLVILPMLIALIIKLMPRETLAYCRLAAEKNPPRLHKSWIVATLIILLWLGVVFWVAKRLLKQPLSMRLS